MLPQETAVRENIEVGALGLKGFLTRPKDPRGLILFAHGSGSSRFSPRNRFAADVLGHAGYATLLFDLLREEEEAADHDKIFDVALLGGRVVEAVDFARNDDRTFALPFGLFGASTGAAAALFAAAARKADVDAVVSRGGRPELAQDRLSDVHAPTLLLVGGRDTQVLALNRAAQTRLRCPSKLTVVPGAGHLFEEKGALDAVLAAATQWFDACLRRRALVFRDRAAAGRLLAAALARRAPPDPVVYALPRGGVPVASEIAQKLDAPLDLILARKIGAPRQPELALGAAVDGENPEIVLNPDIIDALGVVPAEIERLARVEFREIERRRALYLGGSAPVSARGRTAILVDDGIATGASMEAAIHALKRRGPQKIIVAVPIVARAAARRLGGLVDEIVALAAPETFFGVGEFFGDFHQLDDAEVIGLVSALAARSGRSGPR